MKPSVRYALIVMLIAAALLALWRAILVPGVDLRWIEHIGFAIPIAAMIIASVWRWKRKAASLAVLVVVFILGDAVEHLLDAGTGTAGGPPNSVFGAVATHVFMYAVPIAALILFAGGDLTSLWAKEPESSRSGSVCPVCGKRRAGLESHVRDAHGPKALERLRAAGRL